MRVFLSESIIQHLVVYKHMQLNEGIARSNSKNMHLGTKLKKNSLFLKYIYMCSLAK